MRATHEVIVGGGKLDDPDSIGEPYGSSVEAVDELFDTANATGGEEVENPVDGIRAAEPKTERDRAVHWRGLSANEYPWQGRDSTRTVYRRGRVA